MKSLTYSLTNEYEAFWREKSGMKNKSNYWALPDDLMGAWSAREEAIHKWGFAVPNDRAIAVCCKYSPIVEIGAGLGYWAKLIDEAGGKIEAFDDFSWFTQRPFFKKKDMYFPVKKNHDALTEGTLMLVWPCYATPMAVNCLRRHLGDHVIYVGEGEGGCTADDDFHELLDKEWEEVEQVKLPQWWGIHDTLTVYHRKAK